MLTGSFASAFHGSPRATQDIDLVVDADEPRLRTLIRSLRPGEYYVDEDAAVEALRTETQFNIVDLATGWKIDVIIRKSRAFSVAEFARRRPVEFDGVRLAVATAEDMIVAKLEWAQLGASKRQLEDVASILRIRGAEIDTAYVERWVAGLGLAAEWAEARALASRGS